MNPELSKFLLGPTYSGVSQSTPQTTKSQFISSVAKPAELSSTPASPSTNLGTPVLSSSSGGNPSATAPAAKTNYVNSQVGLTGEMTPSTNTPATPAVPSAKDSYQTAFDKYLASLEGTDEENKAYSELADYKLQDTIDQDKAFNKPGQTLGFAGGEAGRIGKENAFAIDALSNKANALTNARTSRTDASKAQLDFEKGLYDDSKAAPEYTEVSPGASLFDPKTGKSIYTAPTAANQNGSGGGYGSTPGVLSPLALAVRNGTLTIAQVPAAQRAQVASELASSGLPSDAQTGITMALDAVQGLLDDPKRDDITGFIQGKIGTSNFDPSAQEAINKYNQLTGILSLANRQQLKGSGAISDFEFKVLSDAASALGRNLTDAQFKSQLETIRDVFQGKYRNLTATSAADLNGGGANSDPLGLFSK